MSLQKDYNGGRPFVDFDEEDQVDLPHKKQVRQKLEDRLERKRLKEDLEFFDGELDGEFDWNYIEK